MFTYLISIPVPGVGQSPGGIEPSVLQNQSLSNGITGGLSREEALKDDQHPITVLRPGQIDGPRREHQQVHRFVSCISQENTALSTVYNEERPLLSAVYNKKMPLLSVENEKLLVFMKHAWLFFLSSDQ